MVRGWFAMTYGELTTAIVAVLRSLKKIDAFAEDTCRHGGEGIPHAQTGDAAILNYQCVNGRMTRHPYLNDFDMDSYQSAQWRPVR
jgi:hypothetical protein